MLEKVKDIIKLIISYSIYPLLFFRFEKVGRFVDIRYGLKVNDPKNISIGNKVYIGRMSRISSFCGGKVIIGDRCNIGQNFTLLAGGNIIIKKDSLIAGNVAIISENHGMNPEQGIRYGIQPLLLKDVTIGSNCWIGEKAIVLPGVEVGDWCIIGAGSVVNKSIPPYSIAVGNPAKVIKKYNFNTHTWERVYY